MADEVPVRKKTSVNCRDLSLRISEAFVCCFSGLLKSPISLLAEMGKIEAGKLCQIRSLVSSLARVEVF